MSAVRAVCAVSAWILVSACGSDLVAPAQEDLQSAPTVLHMGSIDVGIEAELWRDFQPLAPPDGRGLAAVVRLKVDPFSSFRPDVTIVALHVVRGGEVWSSVPEGVPQPDGLGVLAEVVSRDGPKWGPAVRVDVVAEVRSAEGTHLLKAPSVLIQRTD